MAESRNQWTALLKRALLFGLHKSSVSYLDNQGYDTNLSSHYKYLKRKISKSHIREIKFKY